MIRETRDLLTMLEAAGFTLTRAEYESGTSTPIDEDEVTTNPEEMAEHLCACGHGVLRVSKQGTDAWIYLVGGNGPEELVCNYSVASGPISGDMSRVISAHSLKWESGAADREELKALVTANEALVEALEELTQNADAGATSDRAAVYNARQALALAKGGE